MRSIFFACVLVLLQFCCSSDSYQPSTLPDAGDPKFIEECVQAHNRFRSGVNPPASNMLYMVRGCSRLTCKCVALWWCLWFSKIVLWSNAKKKKKKKLTSWSHKTYFFLKQRKRLWLSDGFMQSGVCILLPGLISSFEPQDFNAQPNAVVLCCEKPPRSKAPQLNSPGCNLCTDPSTTFHTWVSKGRDRCQTMLESCL